MGDHSLGPHDVQARGNVYRIVQWLDTHRDAFCISRITLRTGLKLRGYGPTTPDDPRVMAKLWPALDELLAGEEREALLAVLREPSHDGAASGLKPRAPTEPSPNSVRRGSYDK